MAIAVKCRECGQGYKVNDLAAGKRFKCKNCGEQIVVSVPATGGAGEDAADRSSLRGEKDSAARDRVARGGPRRSAGKSRRAGTTSARGKDPKYSVSHLSPLSSETEKSSRGEGDTSAEAPLEDTPIPVGRKTRMRRKKPRPAEVPVPLISAVWYPLTGSGAIVIGLYAVLLVFAPLIPIPLIGPIVMFVVLAYVGLLFLETASFTLSNIPTGPQLPGFTWGNLEAGTYSLVAILIAHLPRLVGGYFVELNRLDVLLLTLAGLYYLPMAFLAIAELENEWALNPFLVIRGIVRMPGAYIALVTLAGALFFGLTYLLMLIDVPFLQDLGARLGLIYVTVALMRAVSLVYVHRGLSLEA